MPGGDRHQQIRPQRFLKTRGYVCAEVARRSLGSGRVDIPHRHGPAAGDERPHRGPAVDPDTDDRGALRVRAPQNVSGDHRRGSGSQRGHRAGIENRFHDSGLCVGEHDEAAHGGKSPRWISRKGRDPFQQCVPTAERRHRAEVARRVVRDIELRLHRPLAARVGDERLAHGAVGCCGRDGGLDVPRAEERNHRARSRAP